MKKYLSIAILMISLLYSCKNEEWEFPDYKYSAVYFPYQSPVRTLVLGEDIYDNTLDNAHKCLVMATMGGVYANKNNISLDVVVDNTLCNNLKFERADGEDVIAMPSAYYRLPETGGEVKKIVIPSGKMIGGIEVELTDAFFADPRSIRNTFVIPLRITSVTNADSVLNNKNYILYAVKYINPWHGSYLRRGGEVVTGKDGATGLDTSLVYRNKYVEKDQVCNAVTQSLNMVSLSLNAKSKGNLNIPFQLILTFDENGKCQISQPDSAPYTITGSGAFVKKGDAWGNQPRDVLHLKYTLDLGTTVHTLTDTLVLRDRGVKMETFNPVAQ